MKRIIHYIALAVVMLQTTACTREMMEYEGMEGVYFSVRSGTGTNPNAWPFRPNTNVEFVKQPAHVQELTVNISVTVTGSVKDYDRPFLVELNPDSTTAQEGVHFLPIATSIIIPANSITGVIPVTVKRTADMLTENKKIGLRLVANEHFDLAFPQWKALPDLNGAGTDTAFDATLHTIYVSDLMVQPAVWRGNVNATTKRDAGSWGGFTRKKLELMCQRFNLKYEDFGSETTMPLILSNLITSEMRRYLVDQFNAGTPVKEDDGRLMWVDSCPWISVVGVPY